MRVRREKVHQDLAPIPLPSSPPSAPPLLILSPPHPPSLSPLPLSSSSPLCCPLPSHSPTGPRMSALLLLLLFCQEPPCLTAQPGQPQPPHPEPRPPSPDDGHCRSLEPHPPTCLAGAPTPSRTHHSLLLSQRSDEEPGAPPHTWGSGPPPPPGASPPAQLYLQQQQQQQPERTPPAPRRHRGEPPCTGVGGAGGGLSLNRVLGAGPGEADVLPGRVGPLCAQGGGGRAPQSWVCFPSGATRGGSPGPLCPALCP